MLYIDLDGFKSVNDVCGHAAGDQVLIDSASRLREAVRPGDTVARIGGDEFAVLLEGVGAPQQAAAVASRLHHSFNEALVVDGRTVSVRASVGLASVDSGDISVEELIHRADLAMYAAKTTGKNRTVVWHPHLENRLSGDQELTLDLQSALVKDEMAVVYQPIVDVADGAVDSFEALLRWHHPGRGLVGPDVFIPLAERSGLISALTRWVLERACEDTRRWEQATGHPVGISVNISASELGGSEVVDAVSAALARSGLDPARLELEITEAALVTDFERASRTLTALKQLGVQVAIDDFGTGYSSLSYLDQLPVNRVKIDRSFVRRLGDPRAAALVRQMVSLAHALELAVTAEGIEEPGQRSLLAEMGCEQGQGFLFARPGPFEDLVGVASTGAVSLVSAGLPASPPV